MSLILTPEKMTFEHHEKIKHVKLTNLTKTSGQNRPIMFKIKTNKIDLVDAKPSCGYISGKSGNNEISVAIRWLNNTGDHQAKLQILYVANDRITEEMVAKNYAHFDSDEYNQNYQAIKSTNQANVMTTILPVIRKVAEQPQSIPQPESPLKPESHSNIFSSTKHELGGSQTGVKVSSSPQNVQSEVQKVPDQSGTVSKNKFWIFIFAAFLVGLLAGFSLGKSNLKQATSAKILSQKNTGEKASFIETERQEVDSTLENVERVSRKSEQSSDSEIKIEDLREFVSQQEKTDQNKPSTEETKTDIATQQTLSSLEVQANTVEQTL